MLPDCAGPTDGRKEADDVTPSIWSVLVIFVLAPLGVALIISAVVLLLVSPSRQPVVHLVDGSQDEGSDGGDERSADTEDEGDAPQ
ncbi:MAG: hypothetical protein CMJ44_15395 [Pimelobacter sp.]|nr:hypothetical protein [Pimelobacter sp.]